MKPIDEDDEVIVYGGGNWKGYDDEAEGPLPKVPEYPGKRTHHYGRWVVVTLAFLALLAALGQWGYRSYKYRFPYPLSRTQSEVIRALEGPVNRQQSGIAFSVDTILGVPMKFYRISGLQATLSSEMPRLGDKEVFLVTRSADYRYDKDKKKMIGDYIVNGEQISLSSWRAGYFAIVNGRVEIGVGRHPDMRDYVLDHEGCMFRQFALLSAGVLCTKQYVLKGKVSRCAYARMPDDTLYFVETIGRETLYGFADALAEYGFVDAIYITGGAQPDLFYRDAAGQAHGNYVDDKSHAIVVWRK